MPASSAPALPATLATAAVIAAVIALGFLTARLVERRAARGARRECHELESLLREHLASARGGVALRRAARSAGAETLWAALESFAFERASERRRLGGLLERNPHVAAERRALRDDSPWRRELAARRLALLPSSATRRALRRALKRGPELVTLAAALALAGHRDRAALRWVLRHPGALAHRPPRAIAALLRAFGPRALTDIAAALEREAGVPELERAMIETLGLGGCRPACAAIARRLDAAELDLRVAAIRALGRLAAADTGPRLVELLDDGEWPVRAQAAWALGRIAAPEAVAPLAARLTDLSWWVRHHAAYALLALGEPGRDALAEIGARSRDPYARDMACEALAGGFPTRAA